MVMSLYIFIAASFSFSSVCVFHLILISETLQQLFYICYILPIKVETVNAARLYSWLSGAPEEKPERYIASPELTNPWGYSVDGGGGLLRCH